MAFSEQERQFLLRTARRAIEAGLGNAPAAVPEAPPSRALQEPRGAFVTLRSRGALRGCLGYIEPLCPLVEAVSRLAADAAFRDPRFPPLRAGELPAVRIEISVLSPPRRVSDPREITIPGDGVIVRRGAASGVFLPQVAVETGWSRAEFLETLCREKAGLPPDAWRDPETELYTFRVESFSEE